MKRAKKTKLIEDAVTAFIIVAAIGALLIILWVMAGPPRTSKELEKEIPETPVTPASQPVPPVTELPGVSPGPVPTLSEVAEKTLMANVRVTAYCPCEVCCGKWAKTPMSQRRVASGNSLKVLLDAGTPFVAADTGVLPFGSMVKVPGYTGGQPVVVLDRGGAIRGNKIDVFFSTHEEALEWGVKYLDVEVVSLSDKKETL